MNIAWIIKQSYARRTKSRERPLGQALRPASMPRKRAFLVPKSLRRGILMPL